MSDQLSAPLELWERHCMALEKVTQRLRRICAALEAAQVPYALVGGQAVAMWVASRDPEAVRTTKDVDLLVRHEDLPRLRAAAVAAGFDYFEVLGVGMLLPREDPHPRGAVHLVWAGEKVRPNYEFSAPSLDDRQQLSPGLHVVGLDALVQMKLTAYRDQDRLHLRDLIEVGLVGRDLLLRLPAPLRARLEPLLEELGR